MATFNLSLIEPEGIVDQFDTNIVNIVTSKGAMGVMANHTPLVTDLTISRVSAYKNNKRVTFTVAGGLFSFENNKATILSNAIEDVDKIDIIRAQKAKQRALKRLEDKSEKYDMVRATNALNRALNRLNEK